MIHPEDDCPIELEITPCAREGTPLPQARAVTLCGTRLTLHGRRLAMRPPCGPLLGACLVLAGTSEIPEGGLDGGYYRTTRVHFGETHTASDAEELAELGRLRQLLPAAVLRYSAIRSLPAGPSCAGELRFVVVDYPTERGETAN
jgi:hypothetical protein